MNLKDFKVGQEVWLRPVNNGLRFYKCSLLKATVIKVGRIYLTVEYNNRKIQFDAEYNFTQKTDYSPDYKLYISKEDAVRDMNNSIEYGQLAQKLSSFNEWRSLSLDQMRRVKEIIEENKTINL